MSSLKMHVVSGPRKRSYALSDSPLTDHEGRAHQIHLTPEELVSYLQAKAEYEKWQEKFRHHRRYGWSY